MKKAIQQTVVARWREEVRDDNREQEDQVRDKTGSAGDHFRTLSDGEESELGTDQETSRRKGLVVLDG